MPILLASGRELPKVTLFYLLQAAGWITFGAMGAAANFHQVGLIPAVLENILWISCGSVLTLWLRRFYRSIRLRSRSNAWYGLVCLCSSAFIAPVWFLVTEALIRLCYYRLSHYPNLWPIFAAAAKADAAAPWLIRMDYWLWYAIVLFTWSSLYFGINAMLDLETERANVSRALKFAETARLRALQSNLSPHFLFNTLNGVATLIREKDVAAASAMVDSLSGFLRTMLQRLNSPEIQVTEELQLIDQYLQIQRFRFGERLRTLVQADPGAFGALIPTLILQPLVENAILHGLLPRVDGGSLWISIHKVGQELILSVEDDGPGIPKGHTNPAGVGLENSIDRLAALYGTAAQLTVGARSGGGGCAVVIRMPFRLAPDTRSLTPIEAVPA
jgi:signal transduction histidine kinase